MLPFRSLDATSGSTTGEARDLEGIARHFTAVLELAGAAGDGGSNPDVVLRGSLDGANWVVLGGTNISSAPTTGPRAFSTADNPHFVRYIRADVDHLTAGSVVSAWIVAADIQ